MDCQSRPERRELQRENQRLKDRLEKADQGEPRRPWYKRARVQFTNVIVLVGLISFYFAARPDIQIDKDATLNGKDQFATQFSLINQGWLSAYDLHFGCVVENKIMHNVSSSRGGGHEDVPRLAYKESTTRNCSMIVELLNLPSDVTFNVGYELLPGWEWTRNTKAAQFTNRVDKQGNYVWFKRTNGG